MAGVKISALPGVPSCAIGDIFPEVQPAVGGVTYKATFAQLATLFNSNLSFLPLAGGTMSGAINMGTFKVTNAGDPTANQDLATKFYVDSVATGLNILPACYAASTVALTVTYANGASGVGATLTNAGAMVAFAIDSVSPPLGSRILIKNQASSLQNGIYTLTTVGSGAANWVLTRATDYDQAAEINPGDFVLINFGTVNTATAWIETAVVVTIGTDSISFSQFGAVTSFPITLAQGGTNANLTASNGGIFYSTATAGAILAGTATAGLALLSGASTTPSWSLSPPITRINVVSITTLGSSTYTPTAGTKYAIVEIAGAGGGSGGCTGAAGQLGASAGGGGGAYVLGIYSPAALGANATVVIGSGGTAGASGNNAGGNGGNSTFTPAGSGAVLSAPGGTQGFGMASVAAAGQAGNGGTGGAASGGVINTDGGNGSKGVVISGVNTIGLPGIGGNCPYFSAPGINYANTTVAINAVGQGAPGVTSYTNANVAGQAGARGGCRITEFISL